MNGTPGKCVTQVEQLKRTEVLQLERNRQLEVGKHCSLRSAQGKVGIFAPEPIPSLGNFANEKVGKRKN